MVFWQPFNLNGVPHKLDHLHPATITYTQPAKADVPERKYVVEVLFGLHCFTRGEDDTEPSDAKLNYSDSRETRTFDLDRYELSKSLPELVKNLARSKCYHTNHGNFFTVEIVKNSGGIRRYEVYFALSRSAKKGVLNLHVQSAYPRDEQHQNMPRRKGIGFFVLLYNVQNNRPIKPPP
jgi:hypothetical protein